MPEIGNPNAASNSFRKISKYNGPSRNDPANPNSFKKDDRDVGDVLNELSGARREEKFVDKDKHNRLDKDAFLKLLSTQLANQDPFKPVDQKKFAADMAQFAQLEQLTNMNTKMDKSSSNNSEQLKYMGASFIGKAIHTSGTGIAYDGKKNSVNLPFHLSRPAKNVVIRVFDKSNNLIAQIERETMGSGANSVTWNGGQMDGIRAVKGEYHFDVQAFDEKFQAFKGETKAEGVVTGVNFENGETMLTVDGNKKVALRDVDSFFKPKQKHAAAKNNQPNEGLKSQANAAYNNMSEQNH
ncbi:MAG: flagellar hook assembly protein FlgD [Bacteriovoracaceae bacterium]|nr:flagellar hook assembly protein FlgD [Bacteriovoracaceae bacterium]